MALVVILVFVILGMIAPPSSGREYVDRKYTYRGYRLARVPDDIPDDALEVTIVYYGLQEIQTGAFSHLSQCVRLDLRSNKLKTIRSGAFTGLVSLKVLILGYNLLGNPQPYWFRGLFALEELYLNNAGISGVADIDQETFIDLGNLKLLNLTDNQQSFFRRGLRQNTFSHLTALETLRLSSCFITSLAVGTFSGLKHLKILALKNNLLTTLPTEIFQGLESLQALEMADNQLTSLEHALFVGISRPWAIDISNNPLVCDWSMCWLQYENEAESITWIYGKEPTCERRKSWESYNWNCSGVEIPPSPTTTAKDTSTRGTTSETTAKTTAKDSATRGTGADDTATKGTTAETTGENTATRGTESGGGNTPLDGVDTPSTDKTAEGDSGEKGITWIIVAALASFIIGAMVTVGIGVFCLKKLRPENPPAHTVNPGYLHTMDPSCGENTGSPTSSLPLNTRANWYENNRQLPNGNTPQLPYGNTRAHGYENSGVISEAGDNVLPLDGTTTPGYSNPGGEPEYMSVVDDTYQRVPLEAPAAAPVEPGRENTRIDENIVGGARDNVNGRDTAGVVESTVYPQ